MATNPAQTVIGVVGGTPIPVDIGAASVSIPGNIEITNDVGNPIPVTDAGVGGTADAVVVTDASGSLSAKLRGLVKILADVWDSANHWLRVQASPANGTLTDRSGAITTGGTAQNAMAANTARKYLFLINPRTAAEQGIATAEDLWYNLTGTATAASPSIPLGPGDSYVMEAGFVSTQALSVIGATTAHKWTAREG